MTLRALGTVDFHNESTGALQLLDRYDCSIDRVLSADLNHGLDPCACQGRLLTHAQQFQVFCFHIPTRPRGSYMSRRNQRYKAQTNAYNRWLLPFVRFVHNLNQPSLPSPDKCFVARQQGLSQSKRHYGVAAIVDGTRMATLLAESYFSVLGALGRGLSGSQSPHNLQGSTHVND